MLAELSIRNLAIIEEVRLRFSMGFQALTGETGAGKSIIIDALSLIAGGRGSADLVRYGADRAEIEALFELPADHPAWETLVSLGIAADRDEPLIIRREMGAGGKSSSRVNGQMVNLSMLREIGEGLINIHGQHEHQSLLKSDRHIGLLDAYAADELSDLAEQYEAKWQELQRIGKDMRKLAEDSQQALQMADLYRFQVEEIKEAHLKPNEDEQLQEERRKLANAEKLADGINGAYDALYGPNRGLEASAKALEMLEQTVKLDPAELGKLHEQIQNAYYQLEDAAFQLRDYREGIEFNPERLDEIEERLAGIASLKRKYGATIEEILAHQRRIEQELDRMENKDDHLKRLEMDRRAAAEACEALAAKMSVIRRRYAEELSRRIEGTLADLQMQRTRFEISVETGEAGDWSTLGRNGRDRVEFRISPNPGEPLKPLDKIASGGEMSRVMLAIKTIFAGAEQIPVLVFDEVDTGVSGRAAQSIAEKLSAVSRASQVFAITHLPQVACMADAHYLIEKHTDGDRTATSVLLLDGEGRIHELARMIGGVEVTRTAEHHAREMMALAESFKTQAVT